MTNYLITEIISSPGEVIEGNIFKAFLTMATRLSNSKAWKGPVLSFWGVGVGQSPGEREHTLIASLALLLSINNFFFEGKALYPVALYIPWWRKLISWFKYQAYERSKERKKSFQSNQTGQVVSASSGPRPGDPVGAERQMGLLWAHFLTWLFHNNTADGSRENI